MRDGPYITVLMSVYNGSKYLKEAIDSILNQTFRDFEFLIIDDGSNDIITINILKNINDERVRILTNDHNLGLVGSLNKGVMFAKGIYIARMDADDVCDPTRLAKQMEFLEAHPEVGLIGSSANQIDSRGRVIGHQIMPVSDLEMRWSAMFSNPLLHPSVMVRRNLFDQFQYDANYFPAEDYDLWTRMMTVTQMVNIDERLLNIRIHGQSICSLNNKPQVEKHLQIAERTIRNSIDQVNQSSTVLHQLIKKVGNLVSIDEKGPDSANLVSDYLDLWDRFALKNVGDTNLSLLQKKVVAKAARMALIPPIQKGVPKAISRINQIDHYWMIPFFVTLPSRGIAKATAIYGSHLRGMK